MTGPATLNEEDSLTAPLCSVGGKAANLARLAAAGIPVPAFFVVSSELFALFLRENGITWPSESDNGDDRWVVLREKIGAGSFGISVSRPLLETYADLCRAGGHDRVAVRSSGGEEDSAAASFAGQFCSFLNRDRVSLLEAVQGCWASYVSDNAIAYRAATGIPLPLSPSVGVVVQTQIFSRKAGVVFTEHPLEPGGGVGYVEANFGTGESVVDGLATPDAAVFSRASGEIMHSIIATKRRMTTVSPQLEGTAVVSLGESERQSPVLDDRELHEITEMAMRIEALMGAPQDIEWAYDSKQLWILQARPITGPPGGMHR
ncbi:MAG TPA: PEP/pyruvate-binding domain-containing protein [Acidimicrobiales bacterium]|nr:PEP/pyruvate-binding domain-containing protein [Acidimicrobiales bacterium]